MQRFYERLLSDEMISYIFTDIARIDLEAHLPVLTDFWSSLLFNTGTYQNNTLAVHLQLHHKSPLKKEHFERWLLHFNQVLSELFEGEKTELARQRATSIATVMQIKIAQETSSIL
jgi:hemoglobin